jgi:hypothetical protein
MSLPGSKPVLPVKSGDPHGRSFTRRLFTDYGVCLLDTVLIQSNSALFPFVHGAIPKGLSFQILQLAELAIPLICIGRRRLDFCDGWPSLGELGIQL